MCVCVDVGVWWEEGRGGGDLPLCNLEIIRGSLPSSAAIWEYREGRQRERTQSGDFQNGSAIE